jgi:hypothetical protein
VTPLVERGLEFIHGRVNVADGGDVHDTDKHSIIEMLVLLHRAGEVLPSLEIEEWAGTAFMHRS